MPILPPDQGQGGGGGGGLTPEDLTTVDFASISERDSYFSTRLGKLHEDLLIRVLIGNEVIESQQWTSEDSPVTDYNGMYWKTNSVQVGSSSFHLSDAHIMSSVGENVVFANLTSGVDWFPAWQSRFFPPTGRTYTDRVDIEAGGARDPSASTDFNVVFTVNNANTELSKILYVPEETYSGRLEYRITEQASGNVVFSDIIYNVSVTSGAEFTQEFTAPLELAVNSQVVAEIIKNDGSYLVVRAELAFNDRPYTTSTISFYQDKPLAFEELLEYRAVDNTTTGDDLIIKKGEKLIVDASNGVVNFTVDMVGGWWCYLLDYSDTFKDNDVSVVIGADTLIFDNNSRERENKLIRSGNTVRVYDGEGAFSFEGNI